MIGVSNRTGDSTVVAVDPCVLLPVTDMGCPEMFRDGRLLSG
jgi:hypothetical protein